MKYDLIVAGGGPSGLMAAATAAEKGLKVVFLKKKKDLTTVNRLCGQFTNISMINVGGKVKYGYVGQLNLEVGTRGTKVHFPDEGFSIDYEGALRPYMNYVHISPSGHFVYRERNRFFGFFWDKESLLRGLMERCIRSGVEIRNECLVTGAENTAAGVVVTYRSPVGQEKIEARRLIASDGKDSKIVDSLGLNSRRQLFSNRVTKAVGYVLEGVQTELRLNSWVCFTVPSLSMGNFWMFMVSGDRNVLGVTGFQPDPERSVKALMQWPTFAPWFSKAKIVKKLATSGLQSYTPLMEPSCGNVLAVGDSAAMVEVTNPGAVVCGYRGALATIKEMEGKSGYAEYTAWWKKAFDTMDPDYLKAAGRFYAINAVCDNDDVDYLYRLVGNEVGVPAVLAVRKLDVVSAERPKLYEKIKRTGIDRPLDQVTIDLGKVMSKTGEVTT
ncbi:MAG: NAD(P)/FAD-dependent oxidoreductase [Dehalococcoidia bacterium]|nr:NAD(P)/FAD-dependent oxidoreductase [Dehalococcoidia bacterium]